MKLANLDGRAALVTPAGAVDVHRASGGEFGPDLAAVYDDWERFTAAAPRLLAATGSGVEPLDEARLGPPSPAPRQVFAIGLNYGRHAEEAGLGVPEVPAAFTKFPASLAGPFATVDLVTTTVDWEVEIVAVIGRRADHVTEADAWAHVAGLTVGQDLSDRVLQFAAGGQFSLGKSRPGYGPTGPWLVTPDELGDPDDLGLGCRIDGEVVQDDRSSDLIFSIPQLVAQLSAIVPLLPGDQIWTGTPGGVGVVRQPPRFLQAGEVLESWVEGIGTIRNRLR